MLGLTKPVLTNSSRESPAYGLLGDCSRSGYFVHHGDKCYLFSSVVLLDGVCCRELFLLMAV